jgi:hypothetical protein
MAASSSPSPPTTTTLSSMVSPLFTSIGCNRDPNAVDWLTSRNLIAFGIYLSFHSIHYHIIYLILFCGIK